VIPEAGHVFFATDTTQVPLVTLSPGPADNTPPTAAISSPAEGAHYAAGELVSAGYVCADPGGTGPVSCVGTVASGAPFETGTPGSATFVVTATDHAANRTVATVHYVVDPPIGTGAAPPPLGRPPADVVAQMTAPAPVLSGLRLRPSSFGAAQSGASISAAKKLRTGTTVSYRDTLAATVTFTVSHSVAGVRSGKRCVGAPRHRKRGQKTCRRTITQGRFAHTDVGGANTLHFSGRIGGRGLTPGAYRLSARARIGSTMGTPVAVGFHITR
jgi:hypothetical protein